jgi:hypothetical protein
MEIIHSKGPWAAGLILPPELLLCFTSEHATWDKFFDALVEPSDALACSWKERDKKCNNTPFLRAKYLSQSAERWKTTSLLD